MRAPKRQTERRASVLETPDPPEHVRELVIEPRDRTLEARADALADALGEELALEYIARTTGPEGAA